MTELSAPSPPAAAVATLVSAAALPSTDVMHALDVHPDTGLGGAEAVRRQAQYGPNSVSSHKARFLPVLWHQLKSPLLGLLLAAAIASYFVGERGDAVIIGVIVAASVGLGFVTNTELSGPRKPCTH